MAQPPPTGIIDRLKIQLPIWVTWVQRHPNLSLVVGFFLWLAAGLVGLYVAVGLGVCGPIPDADDLTKHHASLASDLYSNDGKLMGRFYLEERSPAQMPQLPAHLLDALIATEDKRFYHHHGIDDRGLMRALLKGIWRRDASAGGGSTLSQQLAKNLFPRQSYRFASLLINKLREIHLARKLEQVYSKEEILLKYLNTVFFGQHAFGIKVASQRYFNQSPDQLSIEQSALLIALLKGPTAYNPVNHPEAAMGRRNLVLNQMALAGVLTGVEADSLKMLPIELDYQPPSHHKGIAPYFQAFIRQQLTQWSEANPKPNGEHWNIYTDGLQIYTTIDSRMQAAAEEAMHQRLLHLHPIMKRSWPGRRGKALTDRLFHTHKYQSVRYRNWLQRGYTESQADSLSELPMSMRIYTAQGVSDTLLSLRDSMDYAHFLLQGGLLSVEAHTGYVRAWVGGLNHEHSQYDHVLSRRQTGSVFKPIVYAAAIHHGIGPCDYIDNERLNLGNYPNWSPDNADQLYGGRYSMTGALTHSVNVASVQLAMQTGLNKVVAYARGLGLPQDLPAVPSLALGTAEVSLYDMVKVYAMIANGGKAIPPICITRILSAEGKILYEYHPEQDSAPQLMAEEALFLREMLQNVVRKGTARSLKTRYNLQMPLGGKTGTTQRHTDGWFIGMTPSLVTGVWVGADDQRVHFRSMTYGQGAYTALPIFGRYMQAYSKMDIKASPQAFTPLPPSLKAQMACDEFSFPLSMEAFKLWWQSQQDTALLE